MRTIASLTVVISCIGRAVRGVGESLLAVARFLNVLMASRVQGVDDVRRIVLESSTMRKRMLLS